MLSKDFLKVSLTLFAITNIKTFANSGFYIGLDSGANYNKYSSKDSRAEDETNIKLSKTRFLMDGVFGYEHKFTSVISGIDLNVGNSFGSIKKKFKDTYEVHTDDGELKITDKYEVKIKSKFHLGIMPKIGYRCTPNLNVYVIAGMQFIKHKEVITTCADSGKETNRKNKWHPAIGCGTRYDFPNNCFVKLEYDHLVKSKVEKPMKYQGHIVKIGAGYVF